MSVLKRSKASLTQRARDLAERGLDRHIRLAVTGLSGAGKTALITGLIEQILYANDADNLSYWSLLREGRFLGAQLTPSSHWSVARFDYESAVNALTGSQPHWPSSTRDVSEIRLQLKYQPHKGLASRLVDNRQLSVDLIDYPGEWLLDLPLLEKSYQQWSEQQTQLFDQEPRRTLFNQWRQKVAECVTRSQAKAVGDDSLDAIVRELANDYRDVLQQCQQQQLYLLQPGRHLLPGQLEGAPVLDFFPWPQEVTLPDQWRELLTKKYTYYLQQVVTPFFKDYFQGFNRQVILVDVLSALERGESALQELKLTLGELMKSFNYGQNSLFKRLFAPTIDKVALVASKADHVAPAEQQAMTQLLQQLLQSNRQQLEFQQVDYRTMATAGVAVSQAGVLSDGTTVIDGYDAAGERRRIAAPKVVGHWPSAEQWRQGFAFPKFYPHLTQAQSPLPHIRLDQLLEFLLKDKTQ